MHYAQVAVNAGAPYRHPFTYAVPPDVDVSTGQSVLVPFGGRVLHGVVIELTETPLFDGEVRALLSIAPEPASIPPHLIAVACWMRDRYFAPIFDCVSLLLAPGAERRSSTRLIPAAEEVTVDERQRAVLDAIRADPSASLERLRRTLRIPRVAAAVEALVRAGAVRREYRLAPPSTRPRIAPGVRLTRAGAGIDIAGPLFAELRAAGGTLPLASLRGLPNYSDGSLRRLIDSGCAELVDLRVIRDPLAGAEFPIRPAPELTPSQAQAVEALFAPEGSRRPVLLHGVTGSGKTEVYLAATAAALRAGRQALILVPEISLTPQTVERFAGRFPGRVAVLHSGLPDGQRYDQWCGIQEGHFDVVVGSRSAIFAPLARPGLIVLDEEHEWTYKQQDPQPRYQTRDVAGHLAALTGASLVLGSATPDVVSYYRATRNRYQLVHLPERVRPAGERSSAAGALPQVDIVDLSGELRAGNRSIFSRLLAESLAECLGRGEQALLFLNRRGSASFLLCRDCGHVPRCPRCALSYTYHAEPERLLCHLCGGKRKVPTVCPRCRSPRIRRLGLGTERVVDEVQRRFPEAHVVRWDRDSARAGADHAALFGALARGEADVLVGTQMVAKGLDLPNLTLAGIVNADLSLELPEFDSAERAFQLLTQVAGRAGRRDRPGRVILQTYSPQHYAVRAAAAHDYAAFFDAEIGYRRRGSYPPFARLTRLVYAGAGAQRAEQEAQRLGDEIRRLIQCGEVTETSLAGPTPCSSPRLRGRWRWQILIRASEPAPLLERLRLPPGWSVDVDPESFA